MNESIESLQLAPHSYHLPGFYLKTGFLNTYPLSLAISLKKTLVAWSSYPLRPQSTPRAEQGWWREAVSIIKKYWNSTEVLLWIISRTAHILDPSLFLSSQYGNWIRSYNFQTVQIDIPRFLHRDIGGEVKCCITLILVVSGSLGPRRTKLLVWLLGVR